MRKVSCNKIISRMKPLCTFAVCVFTKIMFFNFGLLGWLFYLIAFITGASFLLYSPNQAVSTDMRGLPFLWGLTFFSVLKAQDGVGRLREKYSWKEVDFSFPTPEARSEAIESKKFIPSNVLPLGVDVGIVPMPARANGTLPNLDLKLK